MKIIKREFNWSRPLKPLDVGKITGIALHHMAHPTASMDEIHKWHLARGWKGFAYNYWVDYDGNVYECRGLNAGGGLLDPLNDVIISIGFQGDYDKIQTMPKAQFMAGCEIIRHLRLKVPTITTVAGHKHWQATSCPGKYFPLEEMLRMSEAMMKIKDYDDIATWAKESVLNVYVAGIMIGNDEGRFNPKAPITRQEVAIVVNRLLQKIK
jgi:N-acetylmuramoyl-L-alanine amidase